MRRCGPETIRLSDHPGGQQPAAAAAGHAEPPGVDVLALRHRVDHGHQVAEIVARVAVLDDVAEHLPIAGAAPGIGDEHEVARCGQHLELVEEVRPVHGMRAAVDIEDQRVALAHVEARRLDQPGLYRRAVEGIDPELLVFCEAGILEVGAIQGRALSPAPALRPLRREGHDLRRRIRPAVDRGDAAVGSHVELADVAFVEIGDRRDCPVFHAGPHELHAALDGRREVQAAAVGRPGEPASRSERRVDVAGHRVGNTRRPVRRQVPPLAAVRAHHVELVRPIADRRLAVVEAGPGDPAAVRRR